MKKCTRCKQNLPLNSFLKTSKAPNGQSKCNTCCLEIKKKYRRQLANGDVMSISAIKVRYSTLKNRHGWRKGNDNPFPISLEEFATIFNNVTHCPYCGIPFEGRWFGLQVDHIIPIALGGTCSLDNLVVCCEFCNLAKRDKPLEQYLRWLDYIKTSNSV